MTATAVTPVSRYLAPPLLGLGAALAAANWYLRPERGRSWAMALLLLTCVAVLSWLALRRSSAPAVRRDVADAIQYAHAGIVFGTLIMVVSLGVKLAGTLGMVGDAHLPQRLTMVLLGTYFAFTGNALPKILTPLSEPQCDGASAQAVQRFTAWTFVLTGLAFAVAWLVWPPDVAEPVSLALLAGGALAVMVRAVRLKRTRHKEA
jgi:hypothetical protein